MFDYIATLLGYMQRHGIEDFAHPGIEHELMKQIIMAVREVVLARENTPLTAAEYTKDDNSWLYYQDYQIILQGNVYLKCNIEYSVYERLRFPQASDISDSLLCIFRGVVELNAYDEDGNQITTFDPDDFTYLVAQAVLSVMPGEKVKKSQLNYISDFSDGLAVVCYKQKNDKSTVKIHPVTGEKEYVTVSGSDSKYTFINRNGEFVFPDTWYDDVSEFEDGIASVKIGEECYLIDVNGKRIIPEPGKEIKRRMNINYRPNMSCLSKKLYKPSDDDGQPFYLDEDEEGNTALFIELPDESCRPIKHEYDTSIEYKERVGDFSEGLLFLLADDPDIVLNAEYGHDTKSPFGCCIDKEGNIKYDFYMFERIPVSTYSEGYALFRYVNPSYCDIFDMAPYDPYFDIDNIFEEDIYEGYCFVDHNGEIAINQMYYEAYPFKDGIARVKILGRDLFINKEGKIVF